MISFLIRTMKLMTYVVTYSMSQLGTLGKVLHMNHSGVTACVQSTMWLQ